MPRDMLSPGSDESILVRAFGIIRRRKAVATVAFATVFAGLVSFVMYLPDLYRASAIVVVERPLADLSRPAVGGDLERRLHVIKQEVLSRDRLTDLVNRYGLYSDLRHKMSIEDILIQARNDIDWVPNGPERTAGSASTVTFNLTYTGTDKHVVADVTNSIADFYVAYNDQMRSDAAKGQTQLLKKQLDTAREELARRQQAMSSYAASNSGQLSQATGANTALLLRISEDRHYVRNEISRQQTEKIRLQDIADEAAAAAGAVASKTAAITGAEDVPVSPELKELITQLDKAKEELQEAQTSLAEGHPAVARARERIQKLDVDIKEQKARDVAEYRAQSAKQDAASTEVATGLPRARRTVSDIDREIARLQKSEQELNAQIEKLSMRFEGAGPIQQQYLILQKEYESARGNLDTLQREYDRALQVETVETGRQGERFRVIDAAIPPEGPAAPNRLRLLIMGLLLALGVAAIAVISAEKLDTSFHSIDDLRQYTTVPVIGTIPRIGPTPVRGYARMALGTVSAVAVVVLVATLSAYFANGNEQLVRMLQRAG
jgi:succinoglycan biosynthesis transport protein ExoP